MNDNLNTPVAQAEVDAFIAADDTAFRDLLATKPIDGQGNDILGYLTDTDEAADEEAKTLH